MRVEVIAGDGAWGMACRVLLCAATVIRQPKTRAREPMTGTETSKTQSGRAQDLASPSKTKHKE